jgi:RNA polymerase sigma-70 factor (ECF subfamily)
MIETDARNPSDNPADPHDRGATSYALLRRVQQGEAEGWQRLVGLYAPLVLWWCRRAGLRDEDAQDVMQEVFATVSAKVADFRRGAERGSFRRWLCTITRYKIGDHIKACRGRPQAAGGSDVQAALAQLPAADEPSSAADEASERGILCRRILEAVRGEFEPRSWQAAWRTAVEGEQAADVAADLGLSVGAVYTAKSRVLARLRQELRDLVE